VNTRRIFQILFCVGVFLNAGVGHCQSETQKSNDGHKKQSNKTVSKPVTNSVPNTPKSIDKSIRPHEPVVFYNVPQNPSDPYPKSLIYDVIDPEYGSYLICNKTQCQRVRNFGHDENLRSAYEEFLIHKGSKRP